MFQMVIYIYISISYFRGEGSSRRYKHRVTSYNLYHFIDCIAPLFNIVLFIYIYIYSNTPLEGLWGLINVLQLISYTMLLPLLFPKNLLIFLGNMAMVHGFNKFTPNLFKYILYDEEYSESPLNDTYKNRGFSSRTMILLVGSELTTFCFIFILIGILLVLKKYFKYIIILYYIYRPLRNIIAKLLKALRYSAIIRSILTGYLKIILATFLNFAVVNIYIYIYYI